MAETHDRKFKLLGSGWLGLGVLWLALGFVAFLSVVLGDDPATAAFEAGDKWPIVVLVFLVLGSIFSANGLGLLRRNPVVRPFLAISSLVLFIPSAVFVVFGIGVLLLLIVGPSLWLTLSKGGKEALESYMARANG